MKSVDWLSFFKFIATRTSTSKVFTKAVVKSIVTYILKFSGVKGYIASQILYPVLKTAILEIYEIPQELRDHIAVKKFKKEIESDKGNTPERQKSEEDILTGGD